jgi:tRNA nucleotidyltransferase/poly(A) polymerase
VLKSRDSNDRGALRSIVDAHNRDAKDPIRYSEEPMYDDIKKHMPKVRKPKNTNQTNHTNHPNPNQHHSNQNNQNNYNNYNNQSNQHHSNAPNYSRSHKGARNNESEKVQSSYSAPIEQNNINLMGHYGFNPYGQMPNAAQQLQLQMQMQMMTMGNHQNGRCENYPTFIRKAVESSDEGEEQ